jgi:glycosyltransferase involved in cell wall biosynthesis
MKPTVALAMIVAASDDKEAAQLATVLGSVNGYVDAIYLQLNARKGKKISPAVKAVAEQFGDVVYEYEWKDNFVDARQDVFDKVDKKYDWVMWLDSDDKVENPEMIVPSLAVMPTDVNCVHIFYDYQRDEYGNLTVGLWNSRVVRNNGSYAWKSSIDDSEVSVHETLNPTRTGRAVSNDEWKVIHQADEQHHQDSLIRNLELLEGMFERQSKSGDVDPRILFYLATHYYDAYNFKDAKELFYQYLKVSGWPEERAEAHVYMGKLLKMDGNLHGARTAFLMGMGEYPDNPGAYLELAKLEAKEQRWQQSAAWAKRGLDIDSKITSMVKYNHEYDLLTFYSQALSNQGGKHLTEALKVSQKALKLRPYDPAAKENYEALQKLIDYRNNLRGIARLLRLLKDDDKKTLAMLDALPTEFADSPLVIGTRQEHMKPQKWPKRSIAIYVGQGPLGSWGPWSLDEGGIGGSEEAVVRLSNELAAMGWLVKVYATPGTKAGYYLNNKPHQQKPDKFEAAVEWKHYWEFNYKDTFDVLVCWRQPAFFDTTFKARKTYLWLHDVMEKNELSASRIKNITKVIYVSKYHSTRTENESIEPSKKLASGNGIDPSAFAKYDSKSIRRDNHRVIYMSANERGLRILLDIWPDVLKSVPNATLSPYYGWQSFDAVNRDNPERMAWKATMVSRMKEMGIPDSTRLGHDELTQEMFKSGIWAYPSFFPEVNCITAQKAMAAGCWPVTSNFAALQDVVGRGDVIDMGAFSAKDIAEYKDALIHRLLNPIKEKERKEMMDWARKTYSWTNTAQQWDGEMS